MPTTLTWSARIEGCEAPCVEHRASTIHAVVAPPGDEAAATVLRWWFEDDDVEQPYISNWQSHIGEDETVATAHVMIHAPAELAGLYEVQLELQITARGYAAEPDEHQDVVALLGAPTAATEPA